MEQEIQANVEEEKFIRAIGKWMLRIAVIILCINVICRMVDAGRSTEYVQVMGTVTKVQESTEWVRAGNRSSKLPSYGVWIQYQPQGYPAPQFITEDYSYNMFSNGDAVPVLYRKDAVYKAYAAKKDWVTGAYLPMSKNYNLPLIISVVLFAIGFLFYMNLPILEWFAK